MMLIIFLMFISYINCWQFKINYFDFDMNNLLDTATTTTGKAEINVFESEYLNNDYFNILSTTQNNFIQNDAKYVLVGARNYLYNLSLPSLTLINKQIWHASDDDRIKCLNDTFINNKDECDNYIKIFLKINENNYQICSTNAYNPKCIDFQINQENQQIQTKNTSSIIGYIPIKNDIKYFYNLIQNKLYAAYSNDYFNNYYSSTISQNFFQISTNIDDRNWLNKADFVNTFNYDDSYVYFVFNENQLYETSSDTIKSRRVSKISRVCLNDNGASFNYNNLNNIWTTFLKTKINCVYKPKTSYFNQASLFYFDEIKSMSSLYQTKNSNAYFYATFTTSESSITSSAICVFYMNDIIDSFNGDYNIKKDSRVVEVPNPRPSSCPASLTYEHLLFTRKNIAMKNEIYSEAIIVESTSESRFTKIDVDFHVENSYGNLYDVLFVGTDNGVLMKFVMPINKATFMHLNRNINNFYKEKFSLFDEHIAKQTNEQSKTIDFIKLYKNNNQSEKSLIISLNSNKILTLKKPIINNCELKTSKKSCDNQINPYCVWLTKLDRCAFYDKNDLEQNKLIIEDRINAFQQNQSIIIDVITDGQITTNTQSSKSKTNLNNDQNVFIISFLFVISIVISFIFGIFLTLKIIISKTNSTDDLVENTKQSKKSQAASLFFHIRFSLAKLLNFKNLKLFSFSRNNKLSDQVDRNLDKNQDSMVSSNSENSDNLSDPRYVYVLNLVDNCGRLDNTDKSSTLNSNSDNYSYLNNCTNATPSVRTVMTTLNDENFYLN